MSPTALTPDVEALVTDYLQPLVEPLGAAVVDQTPDDITAPWVRLTLINAPADPVADHAVEAYVQLDCYAGARDQDEAHAEASLLARTARARLKDMPDSEHEEGIVSDVVISAARRLPDTAIEPARERFIVTAIVYCHARPA